MKITITIHPRCNAITAIGKIIKHIKKLLKVGQRYGRGNNEDYKFEIEYENNPSWNLIRENHKIVGVRHTLIVDTDHTISDGGVNLYTRDQLIVMGLTVDLLNALPPGEYLRHTPEVKTIKEHKCKITTDYILGKWDHRLYI